jgi:hypothetical protein
LEFSIGRDARGELPPTMPYKAVPVAQSGNTAAPCRSAKLSQLSEMPENCAVGNRESMLAIIAS